jgi:hypothetical protein
MRDPMGTDFGIVSGTLIIMGASALIHDTATETDYAGYGRAAAGGAVIGAASAIPGVAAARFAGVGWTAGRARPRCTAQTRSPESSHRLARIGGEERGHRLSAATPSPRHLDQLFVAVSPRLVDSVGAHQPATSSMISPPG